MRFHPFRRSRQRGFTLLELIVAAGILALIAVFSWRGLDTLIREREAIAASQAVIDVMQRSFARLERDALFATDVQLDGSGTMRMSGLSSSDGATGTTIEYRLVAGTLSRSVMGADGGPLPMIDGIGSLAMEAWSPGPRGGGAWVRTKGMAMETRAPATPGTGGSNAAPTPAPTPAPNTQPVPPAGTVTPPPQPAQGAAPSVAAATGVRFSFAFVDGTRIVRSFMVGGG